MPPNGHKTAPDGLKIPRDGQKKAPRGQNGPQMAPRGPQEGPKTAQRWPPSGHKTAPDGPKIAVESAFFSSLSGHIELTAPAGPILKEGAAVVRPVGVFDPPPPSVEGERGVSNLGPALVRTFFLRKKDLGGLGAHHRRPRTRRTRRHPCPPGRQKSDRKNSARSLKFGSQAVLGPLGAVLGPASGLLGPSWD